MTIQIASLFRAGMMAPEHMEKLEAAYNSMMTGALPPSSISRGHFGHRLTLVSGLPVMGMNNYQDQTTLYLSPYTGNLISIYNGTLWQDILVGELSLSLAGLAGDTVHDIFLNYNGGSPTLSALAWASQNVRATGIVLLGGVYVRSGTPTALYVGTIRTFNAGACDWVPVGAANNGPFCRLYVWNYFNRVQQTIKSSDLSSSWTYSVATVRQMHGDASYNKMQWVQGLIVTDTFFATQQILASSTSTVTKIGLAVNKTNALDSSGFEYFFSTPGTPYQGTLTSLLMGQGVGGYNYVVPVEASPQANTITFYGGTNYHLAQLGVFM